MNPRRLTPLLLAGLIAATAADPSMAGSLGRLFYTPEQRAKLDRQGDGGPEAEAEQPTEPRRVDGLVRRSGGPATVWVDGAPVRVDPARRGDGPSIDGDRVVVKGLDGRPVRLLPGQTEGQP